MSRGADANRISGRDRTAQYEAVEWDKEDFVELLLLQDNLDVNALNAKPSNRTALKLAAGFDHVNELDPTAFGHPSINANHQEMSSYTALSLATAKGDKKSVSISLGKAQVEQGILQL